MSHKKIMDYLRYYDEPNSLEEQKEKEKELQALIKEREEK